MLDRQIEAAIFLRRSFKNRSGLLTHGGSSDCLGDRCTHARGTGSVHPGECQQMTTVGGKLTILYGGIPIIVDGQVIGASQPQRCSPRRSRRLRALSPREARALRPQE